MARIFPELETNFNGSYGEKQVFDAFKNLPDDWYIFHSIKWSERRKTGYVTWGEADFIVLNKRFGMLVLEIKSGIISCKDGIFRQKRIDTGEEFNISPFEQADRSKYKIRGELSKHNLSRDCFVDKAVWFPSVDDDLNGIDLPLDYKRELILTSKDLDTPLESLEKIFNYYGAAQFTSLSDDDFNRIIDILIPEFNLIPAFGLRKNELGFRVDQLTQEQQKILDFIDDQDNVAISGSAGTGKTFIALERARRICSDDKKVLFLCYNRQLRDYLSDNFYDENIKYYTVHQLLHEQGMLVSLDETLSLDLLDNFSFIDLDYKYCVIDEAQDFDNGILRKLTVIAQKEDVKVTIFYDKNQLVIKDELPEIINEFDCKLTLKNNCRNTLHILEACNNSIDLPPNPSHLSAIGTMPELHYSPDTNNVKEAIADKIKELKKSGYGLDDITILTMTTEEKSLLAGDYSIAGYKISDKNDQSGIHFTTARKFKGLESNCVIIVDFDIKQINDQGYKLLFYVATSRAKQNLDVFAVADSNVIDESTSDMDGPFSSTIKMANRLKMKITEI